MPTSRGSRCVPSAPGMMPRFTSGWPRRASGAATRKWPGHGHLEPAAERRPVNCHDDRLREVLDTREQIVQVRKRRQVTPGGVFERADVGAGDEGPAGAANDDGGDLRVGLRDVESGRERLGHARTQGIDRRVVDFDHGHAVIQVLPDQRAHLTRSRTGRLQSGAIGGLDDGGADGRVSICAERDGQPFERRVPGQRVADRRRGRELGAVHAIEWRRRRPDAERRNRFEAQRLRHAAPRREGGDTTRVFGAAEAQVRADRAPQQRLARESRVVEEARQRRQRAGDAALVVDRPRRFGDDELVRVGEVLRDAFTAKAPERDDGGKTDAARRVRVKSVHRGDAEPRQRERAGVAEVHVLVVVLREHVHERGRDTRLGAADSAERFGGEEPHARRTSRERRDERGDGRRITGVAEHLRGLCPHFRLAVTEKRDQRGRLARVGARELAQSPNRMQSCEVGALQPCAARLAARGRDERRLVAAADQLELAAQPHAHVGVAEPVAERRAALGRHVGRKHAAHLEPRIGRGCRWCVELPHAPIALRIPAGDPIGQVDRAIRADLHAGRQDPAQDLGVRRQLDARAALVHLERKDARGRGVAREVRHEKMLAPAIVERHARMVDEARRRRRVRRHRRREVGGLPVEPRAEHPFVDPHVVAVVGEVGVLAVLPGRSPARVAAVRNVDEPFGFAGMVPVVVHRDQSCRARRTRIRECCAAPTRRPRSRSRPGWRGRSSRDSDTPTASRSDRRRSVRCRRPSSRSGRRVPS